MSKKKCVRCKKIKDKKEFSRAWRDVVDSRWGTLVKRRIVFKVCRKCTYRNKSKKIWFKWDIATEEEQTAHLKRFFDRHVIKQEGCWDWKGRLLNSGYAVMQKGHHQTGAHRISYLLHKGEIPTNLLVLHTCDNRKCTNPKHLYIGNSVDNAIDRETRGRSNRGKRTTNMHRKLNIDLVSEIKEKLNLGVTSSRLARDYYVSYSTIEAIKKRRTWKYVK